jgi:hypothetical protein
MLQTLRNKDLNMSEVITALDESSTQKIPRMMMEWDYLIFSGISTVQFFKPFLSAVSTMLAGVIWNYIDAFFSIIVGFLQLCMYPTSAESITSTSQPTPESLYFETETTIKGVVNAMSGLQSFLFSTLTFVGVFSSGVYIGFALSLFCDLVELAIDCYSAYKLKMKIEHGNDLLNHEINRARINKISSVAYPF